MSTSDSSSSSFDLPAPLLLLLLDLLRFLVLGSGDVCFESSIADFGGFCALSCLDSARACSFGSSAFELLVRSASQTCMRLPIFVLSPCMLGISPKSLSGFQLLHLPRHL